METKARKPKFESWFDNYCKEDIDELLLIGEWSIRVLKEKLNITIGDITKPAGDLEKKMVIAIFGITLENIIEYLKKKRDAQYECYNINFANRVELGYTTSNENEEIDEEKTGNFAPHMLHIYDSKSNTERDADVYNSVTLATQWNAANVRTSIEDVKEVSIKALEDLKKYEINLGSSELIIPIFCIIYDLIVKFIKIQRANENEFEYMINIASIVTARAIEGEDGDNIYFDTSIYFKREIKNDESGSSIYE